jgi:hypothetical protein
MGMGRGYKTKRKETLGEIHCLFNSRIGFQCFFNTKPRSNAYLIQCVDLMPFQYSVQTLREVVDRQHICCFIQFEQVWINLLPGVWGELCVIIDSLCAAASWAHLWHCFTILFIRAVMPSNQTPWSTDCICGCLGVLGVFSLTIEITMCLPCSRSPLCTVKYPLNVQ